MRISDWSSDVCSSDLAAEGKVAEAQAELDKAKAFEKRAKAWFDDVKKLSNDVKASRDAGNIRLAYAQYLELKDVFEDRIQKKFRHDASPPAHQDWLLRQLTARPKRSEASSGG